MTPNKDKELLMKDICSRLPYSVKIQHSSYQNPLKVLSINPNGETWVIGDKGYPIEVNWEDCKPYLFPMSSMTDEQREEFIKCSFYERREEDCGRHTEVYYYDMVGNEDELYPNYDSIDYLNAHHFDYRGLIEKGLAIDATNLNIY